MRMASVISFPFREAVADVEYNGKIGIRTMKSDIRIYTQNMIMHMKKMTHIRIL
jgi:hypothetical protein